MSLFRRAPRQPEQRASESQLVLEALRNRRLDVLAGPVSTDEALTVPSVAACVHAVASSISSLELEGYRGSDENGMPLPLESLPRLWREPSAEESFEDWVYKVVQAAMCDGRAWGRIVARDARLSPTQIELVPDEAVEVKPGVDGGWTFKIDRKPVPAADMWWLTGVPARKHPFGVSLVQRASEPIAVQLAAHQYLRRWFRDGPHPTAVVSSEIDLGMEQATALKQRIRELSSGNREPIVLPRAVSMQPFSMPAVDAAIGDVLTQTSTEIATYFLFPPEQVGGSSGNSMTYSNVEQQQILVLQRAIRWWMVKLERALSRAVRPAAIYAKFDENDLIRTDLKTKFDAIIAATGGAFLTVNEGREMDDRAPISDGEMLRAASAPVVVRSDGDDTETRANARITREMPDMHFHLPERHELSLRQEAPVVNVAAPVINVEPTPVTVNVEPTPVSVNVEAGPAPVVNVAAPAVTVEPAQVVMLPSADSTAEISFTRDAAGRIVGATKVVS